MKLSDNSTDSSKNSTHLYDEVNSLQKVLLNLLNDPDVLKGATAGFLASAAYLVEMAIDEKFIAPGSNDLYMLGAITTKNKWAWIPLGLLSHFSFGTLLGVLYAKLYPWFAGPGWARGLFFIQIENWGLWPLAFIADKYHPRIKDGSLPPLNKPRQIFTQFTRHVAFGLVLGLLFCPTQPD